MFICAYFLLPAERLNACLSCRHIAGHETLGGIIMLMDRIALTLAIIGGINWGLVGIFKFDLVAYLFGGQTASVSRVIYTLVALSALWCISLLFREREVTEH